MRRTTSPLASDCQSEAVGLIVVINRTGRELLMISKKSLPSSLEASQMPMYKGLRAREGDGTTSSIIKHTGFVKKLYILAIAWKNRQATGFAV